MRCAASRSLRDRPYAGARLRRLCEVVGSRFGHDPNDAARTGGQGRGREQMMFRFRDHAARRVSALPVVFVLSLAVRTQAADPPEDENEEPAPAPAPSATA